VTWSGHGVVGTGNWALKDGAVSLDDVLRHVDLPRAVGSTLSDGEYPYRWSHTAGRASDRQHLRVLCSTHTPFCHAVSHTHPPHSCTRRSLLRHSQCLYKRRLRCHACGWQGRQRNGELRSTLSCSGVAARGPIGAMHCSGTIRSLASKTRCYSCCSTRAIPVRCGGTTNTAAPPYTIALA
jgi:hypothetical protein